MQRKTLTEELAKTDALIAGRRQQRIETLKPSGTATHTVALKEALDMDKAIIRATFSESSARVSRLKAESNAGLKAGEATRASMVLCG